MTSFSLKQETLLYYRVGTSEKLAMTETSIFNADNNGYLFLREIFEFTNESEASFSDYYSRLKLKAILTDPGQLKDSLLAEGDEAKSEGRLSYTNSVDPPIEVGKDEWKRVLDVAQVVLKDRQLAHLCAALAFEELEESEEALMQYIHLIQLDAKNLSFWLKVAQLANSSSFMLGNCEGYSAEVVGRIANEVIHSLSTNDEEHVYLVLRSIVGRESPKSGTAVWRALLEAIQQLSRRTQYNQLDRIFSFLVEISIDRGYHEGALIYLICQIFCCETKSQVYEVVELIGGLFVHWSKLDPAEICLKIASNDPNIAINGLSGVKHDLLFGRLFELRGKYNNAIHCYEHASGLVNRMKPLVRTEQQRIALRLSEANICSTYGALLRKIHHKKFAIKMLSNGLRIYADEGHQCDEALISANLAICYLESKEFDTAFQLLRAACNKELNVNRFLSYFVVLGKAEMTNRQISRAKRTFTYLLDLFDKIGSSDPSAIVFAKCQLATCYSILQQDESLVMRLLNEAEQAITKCHSEDTRREASAQVLILKGILSCKRMELTAAVKAFAEVWRENTKDISYSDMRTFWATGHQNTCSQWLQYLHILQNNHEIALEWAERNRGQSLLFHLRSKWTNVETEYPSLLDNIKKVAQNNKTQFMLLSTLEQDRSIAVWLIESGGNTHFNHVSDTEFCQKILDNIEDFEEEESEEIDDPDDATASDSVSQSDPLSTLRSLVEHLNTKDADDDPQVQPQRQGPVEPEPSIAGHPHILRGPPKFSPKEHLSSADAKEYYQKLIKPLEEYLSSDPLVIIADDKLFTLPYAAFQYDDDPRHRMITQRPILMCPSVLVYDAIASNSRLERKPASKGLVVGDPTMPKLPTGESSYEQLSFARSEATNIAKMLDVKPLVGDDATKSRVVDAMKSSKVIHIATHADATIDEYGHSSGALILAPDKDSDLQQDSMLTAYEIEGSMDLSDTDLAVLSCCSTGLGARVKAEGVMGLARAFLFVGVPQVLCSLWPITDRTTEPFINDFYEAYARDSKTASESFRLAMTRAIHRGEGANSWAGFYLLGIYK